MYNVTVAEPIIYNVCIENESIWKERKILPVGKRRKAGQVHWKQGGDVFNLQPCKLKANERVRADLKGYTTFRTWTKRWYNVFVLLKLKQSKEYLQDNSVKLYRTGTYEVLDNSTISILVELFL